MLKLWHRLVIGPKSAVVRPLSLPERTQNQDIDEALWSARELVLYRGRIQKATPVRSSPFQNHDLK
jgi:hypothetical protein